MFRLRDAELKLASTRAALDRLPTAVLLLDSTANVMFVNQTAEQLLNAGDGLLLRSFAGGQGTSGAKMSTARRLEADSQTQQGTLVQAFRNAVRSVGPEVSHFFSGVCIDRPSGLPGFIVQVAPLTSGDEFSMASSEARAIAFISDRTA